MLWRCAATAPLVVLVVLLLPVLPHVALVTLRASNSSLAWRDPLPTPGQTCPTYCLLARCRSSRASLCHLLFWTPPTRGDLSGATACFARSISYLDC